MTPHFKEEEFFVSASFPELARESHEKASKQLKACLYLLALLVLEPIRTEFGSPIHITSGFRSMKLNGLLRSVGYHTAPFSLHTIGIACDFTVSRRETLPFIFNYIKDEVPYGELILYMKDDKPDRIHVSLPSNMGEQFNKVIKEK